MFCLKGQCHEIVDTNFLSKNSTWVPDDQAKTILKEKKFSRDNHEKNREKTCVCVVVDYANTESA